MSQKAPDTFVAQPSGRLHTKETFVEMSLEPEGPRVGFEVITKRFVRIEVEDYVWIKRDSVIAYHGDLKFRRERVFQAQAIGLKAGPLREAMKRELVPLARAEGKGTLFVSDRGNHNQIIRVGGGSVWVVSTCVLAFQPSLKHEVRLLGGVGLLSGGIFMIRLSGDGDVAVAMKGDPLTLRVTPDNPVSCDPTAVISWSGDLWPELKTDIEVRTVIGQGGGAAIQMLFQGEGYVVVHARSGLAEMRSTVLKRAISKIRPFIPWIG
jgi:uncharacterized protein (AIM24 family)